MINWETVEKYGFAAAPYGTGGGSVANTNPPTFSIENPFAAGSGAVRPPNALSYLPTIQDSYMRQFSLGVQRELPWQLVGELNFQKQDGFLLDSVINWNQPLATAGSQPLPLPYPRYPALIQGVTNDGKSRYHALEAVLRKNAAHYTFQFSYVWAKSISRLSPEDPYNPDLYIGPRRYVPTEAKVNYVIDLPVGKGRRLLNRGGVANAILGGWTATGFFILHQGGGPLTVNTARNSANVPYPPVAFLGDLNGHRPDRTCDGRLSNPTRERWFDPSCFVAAKAGTFGNSGTGILFGPSKFYADIGIHKNFFLREDLRLQFRGEMFNVFNHPNLGNPVTSFDNQFLRQIQTKLQTPRVIQLALRLNF